MELQFVHIEDQHQIKNIKKDKYNLLMIGITRDGDFYLYNGDVNNIEKDEWLNEKEHR